MDIRADSTEHATASILTVVDLTDVPIEVALPATGEDPVVWHAAEVTEIEEMPPRWKATYRLLLGPDGIPLAAGTYDWIVRVNGDPETPVRLAGVVTVT